MRFERASIVFSSADRLSSIDSLLIYVKNLKEKYKIKEKMKYTKYKLEKKNKRNILIQKEIISSQIRKLHFC